MKITCRILFGIFIACILWGCSSHEDVDGSNDSSSSSIQVTVLFEPGQIGDRGYADHIMSSIPQIEKLQTADKSSHIDAQFLAFNSQRETLEGLRQWSLHRENPFLGGSYQRRLLVLTDAQQASLLDSISLEEPHDEVLMLNTPPSFVDSLAEARWGNHIHVLNISISKEVKQLCRYINRSRENNDSVLPADIMLFRKHDGGHVGDSASIAIASFQQPAINVIQNSWDSLKTDPGEDSFAQGVKYAYDMAIFMYALIGYNSQHLYFFLHDGGIYNLGFLAVGVIEELMPVTYLDTDVEDDNFQFSIKRQYAQALVDWVRRWRASKSVDSIPRVLWHGSWDGYVDSTVPDVK